MNELGLELARRPASSSRHTDAAVHQLRVCVLFSRKPGRPLPPNLRPTDADSVLLSFHLHRAPRSFSFVRIKLHSQRNIKTRCLFCSRPSEQCSDPKECKQRSNNNVLFLARASEQVTKCSCVIFSWPLCHPGAC